ncbi:MULTISPECIES: hypothetical protein [Levilactobacillus]|uniref:hypothetical protein n=1 Tax=Levilactobacillus TaxID=2767886 RepID=UPI0019521A0F|nr:hypothetical protein [Levilactobacillus sp. 244-2]
METRNEKFRRLAELRLTRIFQTMNLIANLSAPQYTYTPEEINELFGTYQSLGEEGRKYFKGPTNFNEMPSKFTFSGPTPTAPDEPSSHVRFHRIAEKRMSRAVRDLRLLCNLSVKSNYTYSDAEVDELFNAYADKGNQIAALFAPLTQDFHFKPKDD